ncbi:MAG TPA: hypothetical protein DDZ51_17355 [Planctomycetaceae bacterium]|nr:hypothetical protein [Planctomycetaceae bacterium]
MMVAFAWVTTGVVISALLPVAGVTSVGELAMACMGVAIWTFLGLLTLPTLSRQASYALRMTLFVSWACMGMLARSVHYNVGRRELWVMLPSD